MHNIERYLNFCRIFGIVSNPIKSVKPNTILHRLLVVYPAYIVLFVFSFCVAGIFYHINRDSDLTIAANWLQFLPNTFGYIYLLVSSAQTKTLLMKIVSSMKEAGEKTTMMHKKEATKYMERQDKLVGVCIWGK